MIFLTGFKTGFALILAIGAQNAFVLRQGIRREHVLAVVLICAVSDATLIAVGVAGIGTLTDLVPWLIPALRWGGVAFLLWYGLRALRSAWTGGGALSAGSGTSVPLGRVVATCLAFTWLNPHVYIDTVLLVGSISAQFPGQEWVFGAGAMTASGVFFASLGFGARLLAPLFGNPLAWRILDCLVAVLMFSVAYKLARG